MNHAFVHTIFCDDVRQEEGNKLSLMGVYSSHLYVHEFPAILPKLSFHITVRVPADKPLRALVMRIFKDEEVLFEARIDEDQFERMTIETEKIDASERNNRVQELRFVGSLVALKIESHCVLKVRAETEAGILKGGTLTVAELASGSHEEALP